MASVLFWKSKFNSNGVNFDVLADSVERRAGDMASDCNSRPEWFQVAIACQ